MFGQSHSHLMTFDRSVACGQLGRIRQKSICTRLSVNLFFCCWAKSAKEYTSPIMICWHIGPYYERHGSSLDLLGRSTYQLDHEQVSLEEDDDMTRGHVDGRVFSVVFCESSQTVSLEICHRTGKFMDTNLCRSAYNANVTQLWSYLERNLIWRRSTF